jgi:hypothetical protein
LAVVGGLVGGDVVGGGGGGGAVVVGATVVLVDNERGGTVVRTWTVPLGGAAQAAATRTMAASAQRAMGRAR